MAYREQEYLVLAMTGSRFPRIWNQSAEKVDFYDLMGAVEMLLEKLNLLDKSAVNIYNESTVSIDVTADRKGKELVRTGWGWFSSLVQTSWANLISDRMFIWQKLMRQFWNAVSIPDVTYEPPSRFPVVQRDISLILPPDVTVQSLVELVRSSDSLIRGVSVFDLFERTTEDGGERSVALSLEIADHTGTLQDERISDILSKVGSNAESKLGAVIRQV